MTDKQRLAKLSAAIASLKKTTRGYTPEGVHWRTAMRALHELQVALAVPEQTVPQLGPIVASGQSILLHDLTHATAGFPNEICLSSVMPAFDDAFGDAGRSVIAPEDCVVTHQSSAQHGDAFYLRGVSKIEYWVGHVAVAPATGVRFGKGKTMAKIGFIPAADGGSHVHCGINARPLLGHDLIHKTNYQHGSPTVGVQLAEALGV